MLRTITGISVLNVGGGKRINVTSDILDNNGVLKGNNHKDSFFIVDQDMKTKVEELEKLVSAKLNIINPIE
ncbi:hypothetical protein QUW36_16340 [Clostridium cadaveris]|uniref:hypothetical protein n=1 Tax=Clostridium cadaveris TaxID=1529 RepID=UPI0025A3FC4F|nr:hypothetical protein [Clostridium cadaveris]MDM8313631.1 hypothetical protein [Clostridium cadaveris]